MSDETDARLWWQLRLAPHGERDARVYGRQIIASTVLSRRIEFNNGENFGLTPADIEACLIFEFRKQEEPEKSSYELLGVERPKPRGQQEIIQALRGLYSDVNPQVAVELDLIASEVERLVVMLPTNLAQYPDGVHDKDEIASALLGLSQKLGDLIAPDLVKLAKAVQELPDYDGSALGREVAQARPHIPEMEPIYEYIPRLMEETNNIICNLCNVRKSNVPISTPGFVASLISLVVLCERFYDFAESDVLTRKEKASC